MNWIKRQILRSNVVIGMVACCLTMGTCHRVDLQAQQARDGRPLEYIESSSPLPGGGTVTSVWYPGQQTPAIETLRETSARTPQGVAGQPASGVPQSVLVQNPSAAPAPTGQVTAPPMVTAAPIAVTSPQVPNLGVPTSFDRSFRNGRSWGPTGNIYAPANLAGVQPAAASLPPTLPPAQQTALLPTQGTNSAAPVQVQNLPPNSWVGKGVVGSPKLYVDGQPVRNLFRFIIP